MSHQTQNMRSHRAKCFRISIITYRDERTREVDEAHIPVSVHLHHGAVKANVSAFCLIERRERVLHDFIVDSWRLRIAELCL